MELPRSNLKVAWVPIGGLPIAVIDCEQSAQLMIETALAKRGTSQPPAIVTSANGQVISLCARDRKVLSAFLEADLIHADGMPLVMASRLKCSTPLPERVATTDLFHDVARVAQSTGASFYFLGGEPDILDKAVTNVRNVYPRLALSGYRHGYFNDHESGAVIDEINKAGPDILWIGMGVPREQDFALRFRNRLTNVGVIKTSGGLFDFLSGKNRRAPGWMQSAGLEWLYRIGLEPRRLFHRYLTTNPHALYLLVTANSKNLQHLPKHWYPAESQGLGG